MPQTKAADRNNQMANAWKLREILLPRQLSKQFAHQGTMANLSAFVTHHCCRRDFVARFKGRSDPNGIRTRVTAVKGRCPGPLDDRVTKRDQYQNCYYWTQGKLPSFSGSFALDGA